MAPLLYKKVVAKRVLLMTLLVHGVSLCLFSITTSYALLMISRLLTGFAQIFIYLYLPAWVDLYASGEKQKTTMMCVLLYSGALGVLIGYLLTARMVGQHGNWHWAFIIQVFATIALFVAVLVIPVKSLDLRIVSAAEEHESTEQSNGP